MTDPLRPREPVEGEYTDSELPLSAELPKEDYEEVEDFAGEADADELDDDLEIDEVYEVDDADVDVIGDDADVDVIGIVDPDRIIPPDRDTPL